MAFKFFRPDVAYNDIYLITPHVLAEMGVKGIVFDTNYSNDNAIQHFVDTYLTPAGISNLTNQDVSDSRTIEAGKAIVVFK